MIQTLAIQRVFNVFWPRYEHGIELVKIQWPLELVEGNKKHIAIFYNMIGEFWCPFAKSKPPESTQVNLRNDWDSEHWNKQQ